MKKLMPLVLSTLVSGQLLANTCPQLAGEYRDCVTLRGGEQVESIVIEQTSKDGISIFKINGVSLIADGVGRILHTRTITGMCARDTVYEHVEPSIPGDIRADFSWHLNTQKELEYELNTNLPGYESSLVVCK